MGLIRKAVHLAGAVARAALSPHRSDLQNQECIPVAVAATTPSNLFERVETIRYPAEKLPDPDFVTPEHAAALSTLSVEQQAKFHRASEIAAEAVTRLASSLNIPIREIPPIYLTTAGEGEAPFPAPIVQEGVDPNSLQIDATYAKGCDGSHFIRLNVEVIKSEGEEAIAAMAAHELIHALLSKNDTKLTSEGRMSRSGFNIDSTIESPRWHLALSRFDEAATEFLAIHAMGRGLIRREAEISYLPDAQALERIRNALPAGRRHDFIRELALAKQDGGLRRIHRMLISAGIPASNKAEQCALFDAILHLDDQTIRAHLPLDDSKDVVEWQ